MNKTHTPSGVAAPISSYSHGVETPAGARWLTVSGQIGNDSSGAIGRDVATQSEFVWQNISKILESAGMDIRDIVKMNAFLLDPDDVADYGAARSRVLGDHRPASTLVYVSALATPEVRVEVEVVAAKVD